MKGDIPYYGAKGIVGLIVNPVTLIDLPSESLLPLVTPRGLGIIFY